MNAKKTLGPAHFLALFFTGAAVLFTLKPIAVVKSVRAQTGGTQGTGFNISSDFDDDVKKGKAELENDPEAQKQQKDVVDGEDQGAGDEENNDIHEDTDIQGAENAQGENEDVENSEVEEVHDADNLDQESEGIVNEHEEEKANEIEGENQNVNEEETSTQNESSSDESLPDEGGGDVVPE